MSIYSGELNPDVLVSQVIKLKKCFPAQGNDFFDILIERLKANNFSSERLQDAVSHVIDNHIYPTLQISTIISWDKRIKLNSYSEMLGMINDNPKVFQYYEKIKVHGKSFWVKSSDKSMYNLKEEYL